MIDADTVIKAALAAGVPDNATVLREVPPADKATRDFVVFTELPGASLWPGEVEFVSYVIEAWVPAGDQRSRLTRAKRLGDQARMALWNAQGQRLTDAGVINRVTGSRARPTLTPSGLDGVYRVTATYDLTLRPAQVLATT